MDLSSKIIKYFPENHLEDIIDNISEVDCRLLWFWNDTLIKYIPIKYSDRMFSYSVIFKILLAMEEWKYNSELAVT